MSDMFSRAAARIKNMIARAVITAVNDAAKMQTVQISLLADEVKGGVERFQQYGFTGVPREGAEALALFLGGSRSHGIVIAVDDRRYRLKGLEKGEVALYDDLGQKVHLTRDGIEIVAPIVTVKAENGMRVEAPQLACTGDIVDRCDGDGVSMSSMRETYNGHNHPGDSGGNTGTPNQDM